MLYRSPAYPGLRLQSVARTYPGTVGLLTSGRPDLLYIRIQNRDNNSVYFWHGDVPAGPTGEGGYMLPEDPADWTIQEMNDAETLLQDFGEEIKAGELWEPSCAHTGKVYSLGQGGTNQSQVIIGFQGDQEQGIGSHQERGD